MRKGTIAVLSFLAGIAAGAGVVGKKTLEEIQRQKRYADKHLALYLMMNQWVKVKQDGKSVIDYFEKNGYKEVAIYGMNYAGETLLNELESSNIKVRYGIDQKAEGKCSDIDVLLPNDELPNVDAVIVTAITFFDEIEEKLLEKVDCPILSLEDILYEI